MKRSAISVPCIIEEPVKFENGVNLPEILTGGDLPLLIDRCYEQLIIFAGGTNGK